MSSKLPPRRQPPKRFERFPVRPSAVNPQADRSFGPSDAINPNPNQAAQIKTECIICLEELIGARITKLPCGHIYCSACLQVLVLKAIKDESLFPAHCCPGKNLEINEYQEFLNPHTVYEYHEKTLEYNSPNRKYCCNPTCGQFLRPDDIDEGLGTCQKCQKVTCTWCGSPLHEGDCPMDESLQQVLRLAELNHWQRCKSCNGLVSKSTGCNRMSCACGASWCYSCGEPWQRLQTCRCENIYLIRERTDEVTDLSTYTGGFPIVPENQLQGQGQFTIQRNGHIDVNTERHRLERVERLIEDLNLSYIANHTIEEIHEEYTRRRWQRLVQERDRVVQEARGMLAREGVRQVRGCVQVAQQAGDIRIGEPARQEEERARVFQQAGDTQGREPTRRYQERFPVVQQTRDNDRAPQAFAMPEQNPTVQEGQKSNNDVRIRRKELLLARLQPTYASAQQGAQHNIVINPRPTGPASQGAAWALNPTNPAYKHPLDRYTRKRSNVILQSAVPFTHQETFRQAINPPQSFPNSSNLSQPANDSSTAPEPRGLSLS